MSTMRCKFCGDVYVYDVRSNGYSEDHCTITCAHADRVTNLEAENDRLKSELANSLPLDKVRDMVKYCETNRSDTRCQASCPYDNLCEFLGDLTSFLDSAVPSLEQYVKGVRGE